MTTIGELLARQQHEIWKETIQHVMAVSPIESDGSRTIPAATVERWQHIIDTPFDGLREYEKDTPRRWANKIVKTLADALTAREPNPLEGLEAE